jgi:hypothetical protein
MIRRYIIIHHTGAEEKGGCWGTARCAGRRLIARAVTPRCRVFV